MEALTEMTARMDANMGSMKAELKSAIEVKIKDAMQSMRSELDETIRHRIEKAMTNVSRETHKNSKTELTERIEKTHVELQTAEVSLNAWTRKLQEDLTETKNKSQARLEAVETRTERGTTPAAGTSTVQPPTFNGNTT
jgi:iron-sulfur cluster repair protein YtfE (RIC family)